MLNIRVRYMGGRGDDPVANDNVLEKDMQRWVDEFTSIRPMLFRLIGRIVRPDEIEDVVQETFLLAYDAARRQKIDNPSAFMLRTARNLALNQIKRAERKLNCSIDDISGEEEMSQVDSVEARFHWEDRFLVFCRAVATLPEACRRAFVLKKIYGLSQNEIIDRLGISASTLEKHVAKGMAITSQYMQAHGYTSGLNDDFEPAGFYLYMSGDNMD
ncbi:MAG TPA: RNA polymerase sigma factor [Hyphomicrobiales bacterium]|nr:RNA polymerase sigma factor [Hyphomicrobiales bacterium]